ncbi:MAG: AI-2E family transporter [Sulfurimonas sp.]|nr:AI-2E family transporter [Sulfurimonas sp.]
MQKKNIGNFFIVMASVVIVLAGIKIASAIVVQFLLSLFIAIILSPAYGYFNKKGIPNGISLLIVVSLLIVFFTFIAKFLGSSVIDFNANLGFYEQQLMVYFHNFAGLLGSLGIEIPEKELTSVLNPKMIMGFASGIIQSMGSLLTNGFVILLTVVFMLLESKIFTNKITSISPKSSSALQIQTIITKIKEYMVLKALMSLVTGVIIWIGLIAIGTDYPFLWALLAFMLNFIPNIGSIIAAVPAVLLTLVGVDLFSAIMVISLYLVVNVLIGSIIEPKVMGEGLGLSTLVVFLSLLFWGWLLGIVGMLLSIPLTIMAKIVFGADKDTKWIAILLGTGKT